MRKDVGFWKRRAGEKRKDFSRYERMFGPEQLHVFEIVHDLMQEADSLREAGYAVSGTLQDYFPEEFEGVYHLEDLKEEELVSVADPSQRISDIDIVGAVKRNETYRQSAPGRGKADVFVPLAGKEEIRRQIDYPQNPHCVIGSLRLNLADEGMEDRLYYFQRIAGRVGYKLHQGHIMRELKRMNEYNKYFGRMLSHDAMNDVVVIGGGVRMALKGFPRGPKRKLLENSLERSYRLESLLRLGAHNSPYEMRRRSLSENPLNLAEVMNDALDYFKPETKRMRIKRKYAPGVPVIFGDRMLLYSVYMNLVGNAIKHGDRKRIALGIEDEEGWYKTYVWNSGGKRLSRDVFEDEVTSDRQRGMGVGLWAVDKVTALHGGRTDFETDEETYTQFNVWLPKP